ncbi:hypothetical protein [Streptomyces genisteinicus]|uniref:Uncharacterized protein n=1 Tax=Streptomyces genisteinicus TaxID=2768068 RepID=A0A7H0I2D9_9ACTN|nr:hypothetical protein [Streptomyces genisteinicus]QNP66955.1 hypothetical protein IAG43_31275 [Streptomyces genisteinicus]
MIAVRPAFARLRKVFAAHPPVPVPPPDPSRPQHNVFEAAAAYVTASVEDDEDRLDEVSGWVAPDALVFGINELACRAVIALARERDEPVEAVARGLLGLPGTEPSRPV